MIRRPIVLWAAILMAAISPTLHASQSTHVQAVTIDVHHVAKDSWRVDYRFAQAVNAIRLDAVGPYRQQSWKVRTRGMQLTADEGRDVIDAHGKPFKQASIEISTFNGQPPKTYAPFNRFSDGGVAFFLGHLQGDVQIGPELAEMKTTLQLHGLAKENVIAPPPNKIDPGGARGYAYFGPAQAVHEGRAFLLIDPQTPAWVRATMQDAAAKLARYYETTYQRPLQGDVTILLSMIGFDAPGLSMNGGAVLGQLAYRFEGQQLIGDHPKKRALLVKLVAHEMAHLWQLNIARGGMGEDDPWIHEGGAEAMALDGLLHTGLWSADSVAAYHAERAGACDKLGNEVTSYAGIYACGLARFDRLGVEIAPLWLAMMRTSEESGEFYSPSMIAAIVARNGKQQAGAN